MRYFIVFRAERLTDISALESLALEKLTDIVVHDQGMLKEEVSTAAPTKHRRSRTGMKKGVTKTPRPTTKILLGRPGPRAIYEYLLAGTGVATTEELGKIISKKENGEYNPGSVSAMLSNMKYAGMVDHIGKAVYKIVSTEFARAQLAVAL